MDLVQLCTLSASRHTYTQYHVIHRRQLALYAATNWITYYISWRISLAWETGDCMGCKTVGVLCVSVFIGMENLHINYSSCVLLNQILRNPSLPLSHLQGLQGVRWWDTLCWFHSKLACCCCSGREKSECTTMVTDGRLVDTGFTGWSATAIEGLLTSLT